MSVCGCGSVSGCVYVCVDILLLNLYCFNHSNDRPCALACECVYVCVGVCLLVWVGLCACVRGSVCVSGCVWGCGDVGECV